MKNIIFDGYLTDKAENHFKKKSNRFGRNLMLFGAIVVFPLVLYIAYQMKQNIVLYIYAILVLLFPLLLRLPKSTKKQLSMTPKQIYIKDGEIVCIAEQYNEIRYIDDVKLVIDYGDFYDVIFPFGKISEKFVCQKSLLSHGTIAEFESFFEGKLRKKGQGDGLREP